MTAVVPVKILLIDDDEDDRNFFCWAVEDSRHNIQCHTSKSAKEALALLQKKDISPDFIFLDLNMPKIDGRACLQELKADPGTANIPVIIFSTSSEQQEIQETVELGAAHFMIKPSTIADLTVEVDNFLTHHLKIKHQNEE